MFKGFMSKILHVDLSRKKLEDEELDEKTYRHFLGGFGLGARIIFNSQKPGVDALGPDNTLGFLSGPLTGTSAVSGTRFTVVGKSPLTGTWGDANCGGYFGAFLKFSGYDGVFLTGISEKPVFLFINNGKAELRDASHLWTKDAYQTEDLIKSELGNDVQVACIGPSGEKLSLIASVMHDKGHAAGRSGLGAVMGSKKLKAVAVKGNIKVPVADEKLTKELRKKCLDHMGGDIETMRRLGTTFVVVHLNETGDSPVKNWGGIAINDFPDATPIGGEAMEMYKLKRVTCYHCPVGCEAHMKAGTGMFKYEAGVHRPEYENIVMFGNDLLNNNAESIIKLNDICNRYGIDAISGGAVMAFALECYENGLINKSDTGGIELTWGNSQAIVAMTEKMAKREGFGDVLAEGVKRAAQRIGKGADKYAIHIQGQEVPAHNPVAGFHLATSYITDATPGRHTVGSEEMHPPGFMPEYDRGSFSGRAKVRKRGNSFQHAISCCGLCLFVYITLPNADIIANFMSAVTGWDVTTDELIKTGERIGDIRQAFNIREGINLFDYRVPDRILGIPPHKEGPLAGITVDKDTLVREFLSELDWDMKTAKPSKAKLAELELEDVAKQLWS